MTEVTVSDDGKTIAKIIPFIAALTLAPLVLGAPAWGLMWLSEEFNLYFSFVNFIVVLPALAFFFGIPSYIVFGAPAFWLAIRHDGSTAAAALVANTVSIPFIVLCFYLFVEHAEISLLIVLYLFFGSVFAAIWRWFFGKLYRRFAKEGPNAQRN